MTVIAPRLADLDLGLPVDEPFTRTHARSAGLTLPRLRGLTASGTLRRLLHGVYVASDLPDSIQLRCQAVRLVIPDDAFVCDRTAAWIYTGPRALGPNEHLSVPPVSCFRPSGRHGLATRGVVSGERRIDGADLRELNGLLVTTELRTALDLGRLQHSRDLRLWGMSNMLSTGAFGKEALLARLPEFRGARGVVDLRRLAPLADARLESFGEAALLNRWLDAGLPYPELQISLDVDGVEIYRLDMGLPEWLFAGEYDGEEDHSSEEDVEHDAERRAEIGRRWRYRIEVFRKQHVFGARQNADVRLRQAAAEARATFGSRTFIV